MKNSNLNLLLIALGTAIILSCSSVPKSEVEAVSAQEQENTQESTQPSSRRKLTVLNSTPAQEEEIPSEYKSYLEKTDGIKIEAESFPPETAIGRPFSKPFTFKVTGKDGAPLSDFALAVSYPESKNSTSVNFGLEIIKSNAEGRISFTPASPSESFNSIIKVYPEGNVTNAEIAAKAEELSAQAPYLVRTNKLSSGGTISIIDFSENGSPILSNSVSSSKLLMKLMQHKFTRIGNASFNEQILNEDNEALFKVAKELLGKNSAFLIFGTVKYSQGVTKTENGYACTLTGKFSCMDMSSGAITLEIEKTVTAEDKNEWNCLPLAREKLAEEAAKEIYYGI